MQLRQTDKTVLSTRTAGDEVGTERLLNSLIRIWVLGLALLVSLTPTAIQARTLPTAQDTAKAAVAERAVTPLDPVSLVT